MSEVPELWAEFTKNPQAKAIIESTKSRFRELVIGATRKTDVMLTLRRALRESKAAIDIQRV